MSTLIQFLNHISLVRLLLKTSVWCYLRPHPLQR